MRTTRRTLIGILLSLGATWALAQEAPPVDVKWHSGPTRGRLASQASVKVPTGYVFAEADDTRTLMEMMGNPTTGQETGFLAPRSQDWFLVFEFESVGYVKDDDKASLDADAMLESIMKGTEQSNAERRKRGWSEIEVSGWETEPHYDDVTHNLEWGIRGTSAGEPLVNYNVRLLGRRGVTSVTLVCDPQQVAEVLPKARTMLAGFRYEEGSRYEEFRAGDKVAKYGLTALVAGGAAAVALKSGLLKYLWKLLVIGGAAVAAFFKRIFGRSSG